MVGRNSILCYNAATSLHRGARRFARKRGKRSSRTGVLDRRAGKSPDKGSSSGDRITSAQNIEISGTADAKVMVMLERADVGVLVSVLSSAHGTWTYDYRATTLTQGTYDFFARAANSGGKSGFSADFLVPRQRGQHGDDEQPGPAGACDGQRPGGQPRHQRH
jgi:hypothetical protein